MRGMGMAWVAIAPVHPLIAFYSPLSPSLTHNKVEIRHVSACYARTDETKVITRVMTTAVLYSL